MSKWCWRRNILFIWVGGIHYDLWRTASERQTLNWVCKKELDKMFAIVTVLTLLNNFLIYNSSLNRDFVWFRIVFNFFMHIHVYGFTKGDLISLCVYHLKINICLPIWRYTVQCTEFESNRFFTGLVWILAVPCDLRSIWFVYF